MDWIAPNRRRNLKSGFGRVTRCEEEIEGVSIPGRQAQRIQGSRRQTAIPGNAEPAACALIACSPPEGGLLGLSDVSASQGEQFLRGAMLHRISLLSASTESNS
jgi:hypothetical protein